MVIEAGLEIKKEIEFVIKGVKLLPTTREKPANIDGQNAFADGARHYLAP